MPLNSNKKSSRKAKILPQFSIPPENGPLLDLLEIQRKSFFDLLEHGIPHELAKTGIFRETAKNSLFTRELELVLNPKTYTFISPNFTPKQAILKGKTYACKLYVQATLIIRSDNPEGLASQQIRAQERTSTSKQNCLNYNSVDSLAGYSLAAYPSTSATYALRFPFAYFARPEGQLRKTAVNLPCGEPQASGLDQINGMPSKRRYTDIPKTCRAEFIVNSQHIVNQCYAKLIPNVYAKWIKKGLSNFSLKISDMDINPYSATEKLQTPSVSKKSIRLTDPSRNPRFAKGQSMDQFNKGDTVTKLEILTNLRLIKFTRELEKNKTGIDFFYQVIRKEEKCRKYGLLEIPVFYSLNTAWGYNSYLLRKAASFGVRNTLKLRNKEKTASIQVTSQTIFNLFSKHLFTYLSLSNTRCYLRNVNNLCKLSQFPYLNIPPVPSLGGKEYFDQGPQILRTSRVVPHFEYINQVNIFTANEAFGKHLKKKQSLRSSPILSLVYPYLNSAKGTLRYAAEGHFVNKKQGLQPSSIFDMQRGTLTTSSCVSIPKLHSIRSNCISIYPSVNGPILATSRASYLRYGSEVATIPLGKRGSTSPKGVLDSHKLISCRRLVRDGSYTCAAITAFAGTGLRSTGLGNKEHQKEHHYPKGACFPFTSKKDIGKYIENSPKESSWVQHIGGKKKPQTGVVPAFSFSLDSVLSLGDKTSVSKGATFDMLDTSSVENNKLQIFRPWIFLGELPLMTKRGHFILNGSPRVIVNQIARCPGIYFQEKRRGVGFEQEVRVSADLIPQRGPWLRIQSDWEGRFWARLKQEGRVKYATLYEAFQEFEKKYNSPLVSLLANRSSSFSKSEIIAFQERKTKEDRQKKALTRLFKNSTRYSLGKLGRIRIDQRIHFRPLYELSRLEQNISLSNLSTLLLASLQKLITLNRANFFLKNNELASSGCPILSPSFGMQRGLQKWDAKRWRRNDTVTPRSFVDTDPFKASVESQAILGDTHKSKHPRNIALFAQCYNYRHYHLQGYRRYRWYKHVKGSVQEKHSVLGNNSSTSLARLHRLRTLGLQTLPYGTKVQNSTNRFKGLVQEQDQALENSGKAKVKKISFSDFLEMEKWLDYFSLTSAFIDQFGKIDNVVFSLLSPLVVQAHEPVSFLGRLQRLRAPTLRCSETFAFSSLHSFQLPLAISYSKNPYEVDCADQRIPLDNDNVGETKKQVPLHTQLPLRKTRRVRKPLRGCIPLATDVFAGMQGSARNTTRFWIRKPFKLNAMHLLHKWNSPTFGDKFFASTYTQIGKNTTEIGHQSIAKVINAYSAVSQRHPSQCSLRETPRLHCEGSTTAGKEEPNSLLMAKDIDAIHVYLERLLEGQGFTDDIDHLKNRFIRTSGKLLQQQFELGLHRLTEVITPLLKNLLQNHFALLKDSGVLPTRRLSKVALGTRGISRRCSATTTTFGVQKGTTSLRQKNLLRYSKSSSLQSKDEPIPRKGKRLLLVKSADPHTPSYSQHTLPASQAPTGSLHTLRLPEVSKSKPRRGFEFANSSGMAAKDMQSTNMRGFRTEILGKMKLINPATYTFVDMRRSECDASKTNYNRINEKDASFPADSREQLLKSQGMQQDILRSSQEEDQRFGPMLRLLQRSKVNNKIIRKKPSIGKVYLPSEGKASGVNKANLVRSKQIESHEVSVHTDTFSIRRNTGGRSSHKLCKPLVFSLPTTSVKSKAALGNPQEAKQPYAFASRTQDEAKGLHTLGLRSSHLCKPSAFFDMQRSIQSIDSKADGNLQPLGELRNTSVKSTDAPFRWLRTSKPINGAFREFFGSNPLSQYMDQTNPLAEITHKRRLSSMGPGGIKRETAGMEVRGIHPTHYGRVCPIETPEGKNAGLVNSPTVYGRIGPYGFLETPLYQVLESQVQLKRWAFFSAQQEEDETRSLATCDTGLMRFNFLAHLPIPVQTANNPLAHFQQVERNRVGYRALSPVQTISIATALIPFLEHDDANRALMGSNMQRQAIPLLLPERPIVGTGFEPLVVVESGQTLQATRLGCVSSINANSIVVHSIQSIDNEVKALPQSVLRNAIDNEFSSALRIFRRLHTAGFFLGATSRGCFETTLSLAKRGSASSFAYLRDGSLPAAAPYSSYPYGVFASQEQAPFLPREWKESEGSSGSYLRYGSEASPSNWKQWVLGSQFEKILEATSTNGSSSKRVIKEGIIKSCKHIPPLGIAKVASQGVAKNEYIYFPRISKELAQQFFTSSSKKALLRYPEGNPSIPSYGKEGMEAILKRIHLTKLRSECILSLHTRRVSPSLRQISKLTKTRLHLCSSHSAFFLAPVKQTLQPYQRSNQETCLHQRPLVHEGDWVQKGDFLADCSASHLGDLSLGKNVTVAYMPWEGYNFEDAIVISDRLVSDDIYTSLHIERYEIKVNKNSQGKERITNRIPGTSRSLKHLDNSGIARISSWVQPGDILIGKVVELKRPLSPYERLAWELASRLSPASPEREKWLNKVWLEDISLRLPPGICGRVINSQIISTEWSDKEQIAYPLEVHIYLAVKRKIQIGDKLAGRHGNKGIVSTILPQQDMPYLGDGRNIDMVLNPLGVPSRMNLGQIFECLLGLAGSQLGCNFKITPFDEVAGGEASRSLVFLKLYQCRLIYKQQWLFTPTFPGKSKLFDGRTGEPFENWVTVGQAYMLKLIHMVDHKIHARSTGPYSLFTRQPVRGRSRRGGQRLGEMEVWAVEGFGAAYTLQEFLTIKSDDLKARTALQRSFYKQNDVTFKTIHISPGNPEAFKVLISELQALCLHIQM